MRRLNVTLALSLVAIAAAFADSGQIRLNSFPTATVADGRSTVTITAEVRQSNGSPVPDGTLVNFNTTLGSFRQSVVRTQEGYARTVLVASSSAGIAKITASALGADAAPSAIEYEFVADRAALNFAREYIEVVTTGYMQYAPNNRLMSAAGINGGVTIRFRDTEITANDVQLNTNTYELRARRAKVKIGKVVQNFDELYLRLNQRKGYGTTNFLLARPQTLSFTTHNITGLVEAEDGKLSVAQPEARYGLVEISGDRLTPAVNRAPASLFVFEDFGVPPSTVMAKRAIVFPSRQIQFQQADIVVANKSVMKMPLFQVNLQTTSPMVLDQLVSVNNSQLAVNYPMYLTLKPGESSILRFRTGESYGRSTSANRGEYLDYEYNWTRGGDGDGGVAIRGIGRNDWSLGFQHSQRVGNSGSMFAQMDMPQGRTFFGSAGVSQPYNGFQVNLSANASQSLIGLKQSSRDLGLVIEKDPIKLGSLPFKMYLGATADSRTNSNLSSVQSPVGLRLRTTSEALRIDSKSNATMSFYVERQTGQNVTRPLAYAANVSLSRQASKELTILTSFDYTYDGFNDQLIGHKRLSLQTYYTSGGITANLFLGRTVDSNMTNLYGDLNYNLSRLWRTGFQYTFDHDSSGSILDYTYVIGYRLGWREIGLIWSRKTHRIGFQLLGATFN